MYIEHFRLKSNPFTPSPGPDFIYSSAELREALAHFSYALENREAFLMLTGEVGTGKTTAVQHVLRLLPEGTPVAVVTHTTLTPRELLEEVANRFGISDAGNLSKPTLLGALEKFFLEQWRLSRQSLLILDEAHLLSPAVLEEVRLLSNLEREGGKLVQICLVGQPELVAQLQRPEMRQLRQRISVRYALKPLGALETQEYIYHRLKAAGSTNPESIFTEGAAKAVHRFTHGIPREINVVAAQALLNSFVSGGSRVERSHVESVQADFGFEGLANVQPEAGSKGSVPVPPPPTILGEPKQEEDSPEPDSLPERRPIPLPPDHLKPSPPPQEEPPEPVKVPADTVRVENVKPLEIKPKKTQPDQEKSRSAKPPAPDRQSKVNLSPPRRRSEQSRNLLPLWILLVAAALAAVWYLGRDSFSLTSESAGTSGAGAVLDAANTGAADMDQIPMDQPHEPPASAAGVADTAEVPASDQGVTGGAPDTALVQGADALSAAAGADADAAEAQPEVAQPEVVQAELDAHFIVLPDARRSGIPITAQIASFKSRAVADSVLAEAEALTRLGGVVLPARVAGEPWFRILLGRFSDAESAKTSLIPLVRGRVVSDIVIRPAPSGVLPLLTPPR